MKKTYTCIICPNGCEIDAELNEQNTIISVSGQTCKRGEAYVRQEIVAPMRTISSSVLVRNGELPLASVRLTKPIPKNKIVQVMAEIHKLVVNAPVKEGDVVMKGICGEDSDIVITKNVAKQ